MNLSQLKIYSLLILASTLATHSIKTDDPKFWRNFLMISPGAYAIHAVLEALNEQSNDSQPSELDRSDAEDLLKITKTTFNDVRGLPEEILNEVREISENLNGQANYKNVGAQAPSGLLLTGAPGTGKTLIARAIAGETKCNFIEVSGPSLMSKIWIGSGVRAVKQLFEDARKKTPAIIFIDEIDAIASFNRYVSHDGTGGSTEYRATLDELLVQFDGIKQNPNITLIAATNCKESLDPAIMRSGRFSRIIEVPRPSLAGRIDILNHYLEKLPAKKEISAQELESLAKGMPHATGADIKDVVNEAAILVARKQENTVTAAHINSALERKKLGITSKKPSQKELIRTAYHEAGHAILQLVHNQSIHRITIINRTEAHGALMLSDSAERLNKTETDLRIELMTLQAGYVAEKLIFGEPSVGCQQDLGRASKLASIMVKELGMSPDPQLRGLAYSQDMKKEPWDKAIQTLLQECSQLTERHLKVHKNILDLIAQKLLEKGILEGKEVEAMFNALRPENK